MSGESEYNRTSIKNGYPKCAVIGGNGYVGQLLAYTLRASGYPTAILDLPHSNSNSNSFESSTIELKPACSYFELHGSATLPTSVEVSFIPIDLSAKKTLVEALQGMQRVFHLASPNPLLKNKNLFNAVNVEGTKHVIEACQHNNVKELVYCSSASVVFHDFHIENGNESLPYQKHKHAEQYSASKAKAEELVLAASEALGLKTIALRPHSIFGHNGFGKLGIVDEALNNLKKGKTTFYIGSGATLSDFTHVQNLVEALILAGEVIGGQKPSPSGADVSKKAYNITNGEPMRLWSFLSNLCGELGYQRPAFPLPFHLMLGFGWISEKLTGGKGLFTTQTIRLLGYHHYYDISRAKEDLGYKPRISMDTGFTDTIEYIKANDSEVAKKGKAPKKDVSKEIPAAIADMRILFFFSLVSLISTVFSVGCLLSLFFSVFSPQMASISKIFWMFISSVVALFTYTRCHTGTVPSVNSGFPLIGDFLEMSKAPLSRITKLGRECRGAVAVSLFGKRIIYLTGTSGNEFFFKASDDDVSMKEVYNIVEPLFGKGVLYSTDLNRRQQQMYFLAQGLSDSNMTSYLPKILKECQDYFAEWGEEGICENIGTAFSELIAMTAAYCLMGSEVRTHVWSAMSKLLHDLDEGITYVGTVFPYFPIPPHRKRDAARKQMVEIFSSILQGRRKRAIDEAEDPRKTTKNEFDVLNVLMKAKYRDGTPFTDDEICGLLVVLMFAGQHTSSLTGTWLFINLVLNKNILKGVIEEQAAFGNVTFSNIMKNSEFLTSCMIESLRLHNPLGNLARYVVKPLEWKGHYFPKGSILAVCTHESGKNPDVFDDPLTFKPTRWLNEDWESWRKQYKYLQFGGGRHTCMGRRFALLQIKTIISYLVRNFVFEPVSDKPGTDETAMVVGPDKAFRVRYKRISPNENFKAAWDC